MRDIGHRIRRYRLSRYAPPSDLVRHRVPWFWLVAAGWIVWAGFLSDHSVYRIWRLQRENARAVAELERVRREIQGLDEERVDPGARRERAEHLLREDGGMAKPDEIVYQIRGGSADSTALRPTKREPAKLPSDWPVTR